jgi:hypothetical protein
VYRAVFVASLAAGVFVVANPAPISVVLPGLLVGLCATLWLAQVDLDLEVMAERMANEVADEIFAAEGTRARPEPSPPFGYLLRKRIYSESRWLDYLDRIFEDASHRPRLSPTVVVVDEAGPAVATEPDWLMMDTITR